MIRYNSKLPPPSATSVSTVNVAAASPVTLYNGQAWIGKPVSYEGHLVGFCNYEAVAAFAASLKGAQIVLPGWSIADGILVTNWSRELVFAMARPEKADAFRWDVMKAFGDGSPGLPIPANFYAGVQYALLPWSLDPYWPPIALKKALW